MSRIQDGLDVRGARPCREVICVKNNRIRVRAGGCGLRVVEWHEDGKRGSAPPSCPSVVHTHMKLPTHHYFLPGVFLAVLLSCTGDSPTDAAPTPAQIQAAAGVGQAGTAEMPLPAELVARVTDPKGRLVPGVTVSWTISPEAGTLSATTTTTDSRGEARTRWTLGPAAGTYTVTASAAGLAPVTFTATAAPAQPARVDKMAGDGQAGAPAGQLPDSLVVRVASVQGRPVAGATVQWVVALGGGTLSAASTVSNAAGIAKVAWTLGAEGTGSAVASVGNLQPATFTATVVRVASVTVSQAGGTVGRGETLRLTATPRDAAGNPLAGRSVQWSSSSPSIASVSDAGVVTGLAYGAVTITATSEGRTAATALRVTSEDRTPPRLKAFSISAATVDVTSGPAQVNVTLAVADPGSGMDVFSVGLSSVSERASASCGTQWPAGGVLASGSQLDGVWKCTATIPKGVPAGTWELQATLEDTVGNLAFYFRKELRAAGFPDSLVVVNSGPSSVPTMTALSLSPTAVDVSEAAATVDVSVSATALQGVRSIRVSARPDRGIEYGRGCSVQVPFGEAATSGTWKCRLTIPRSAPAGTWRPTIVSVQDRAGTSRVYYEEDLAARGFLATVQVTSRTEDVVPPTLTGFSLNASSLDLSTGPKSVEATVTATDAGVGPETAHVTLRAPGGGGNGCAPDFLDGTAKTATMKCTMTFGQSAVSGTYEVSLVLFDVIGNLRSYSAAELRAAGFQTTLTVTR
jgi:hypothetical protein